jgi:hypothetical protein
VSPFPVQAKPPSDSLKEPLDAATPKAVQHYNMQRYNVQR